MKKYLLLILFSLISACTSQIEPLPVNPIPEPGILPFNHATGLIQDEKSRYGRVYWRPHALYKAINENDIPDSFDSRDKCKMPIKDQGQCGSCWAFGSHSTAEVNYCFQTGSQAPATQPFGPQVAVSCDKDYYGCNGGLFTGSFSQKYGFFLEKDWPYTSGKSGNTGRCDTSKLQTLKPFVKPKSFVYIGAPDRKPTFDEVTAAISQYGAVSVSAGADGSWDTIKSEDKVLTRCYGTSTNHLIAAVAFHRASKDLTIQNSWSQNFGASGYLRIAWGCDNLTEDAGYFIFEGTPGQPPKIHLPAEYIVNEGDDLTMAVKAEINVSYQWLLDSQVVGSGAVITVTPINNSIYRLIAKNSYGEAEVMTLVTIKK